MDKINLNDKTLLVTDAAGFIGSNLVKRLLRDVKGATIIGIDNINDYYDVRLKEYRLSELNKSVPKGTIWEFIKGDIADRGNIDDIFSKYKPAVVVSGVQWTGKKADFVELFYGLQTMGVVNDGKTNVRDLLDAFNSVFGNVIPFEQCYATYEAIKRRKLTAKAAFLESMLNGLHNRMKEDERKEQARS